MIEKINWDEHFNTHLPTIIAERDFEYCIPLEDREFFRIRFNSFKKEEMTQIPGCAGVNKNTLLMSPRLSDYHKFTHTHGSSAAFRDRFRIKDRLICRGLDDENRVLIVMTMKD